MTARATLRLLICLLPALTLSAQQFILRGTVLLVDETGASSPAVGVEVKVMETGDTNTSKGDGWFVIHLEQGYKPGRQITVAVAKPGWAIWQPPEGRTPIPDDALTIKLLPEGSKRFLTDQFIQMFIESTVEKAKAQVKPSDRQEKPKPVEFGPMIREWAAKYGFTPELAKEQIDKWIAEVQRNQGDIYKLGLAAFAERNFKRVGDLFIEAAEQSDKERKAARDRLAVKTEETIRNFRAAGDARYSDYRFEGALSAYERALAVVARGQKPELWAAIQIDVGCASSSIGQRAEGDVAHRGLDRAVGAYRAALEVYTRAQLPQQWATSQNNLGIALQKQGTRTGGEEGRELLAQSVASYRAALEVRTRAQLPQQWATTQNNLARSYFALENWDEAAASYRNVLKVYPGYREAYSALAGICHEKQFDFQASLALHQDWLERNPRDLVARTDLAKALFTVGRFEEAAKQVSRLLADAELGTGERAALRGLEIAALLGQRPGDSAQPKLQQLIDFVAAQDAGFRIGWTGEGTKHFIQTDDRLAPVRPRLLSLIAALEGPNRDAILQGLRAFAGNQPGAER